MPHTRYKKSSRCCVIGKDVVDEPVLFGTAVMGAVGTSSTSRSKSNWKPRAVDLIEPGLRNRVSMRAGQSNVTKL